MSVSEIGGDDPMAAAIAAGHGAPPVNPDPEPYGEFEVNRNLFEVNGARMDGPDAAADPFLARVQHAQEAARQAGGIAYTIPERDERPLRDRVRDWEAELHRLGLDKPGGSGLHTIDLASFLAEPPRVASAFTVEGLFPVTSGVIVLAGPQKTSKTVMAMQLALSVSGGSAGCLGRKVGRHGPALFIEEEGNRDKLRERLSTMLTGLEMERPPVDLHLSLFERVQVDDPESMALIEETVGQLHPVVVVLDPLAYLHGQDENDNTAMRKVTQPLVWLAARHDLLVIVLHHVAKNASEGGNTPGKRIRGAGSISAASDGNIVFNRTGPTTIRAQAEYRDAEPLETFYRFDKERMILVEEPAEITRKVTLDQILELVHAHDSVSVSMAAKEWKVARATARDAMLDAAEAGAIDHAEDPKLGHLFMVLGVAT